MSGFDYSNSFGKRMKEKGSRINLFRGSEFILHTFFLLLC